MSIETQTVSAVSVVEEVDISNVEVKPWTNDDMRKILKKMQMSLGFSEDFLCHRKMEEAEKLGVCNL